MNPLAGFSWIWGGKGEDMIRFLVMDTGFASSQKRKRLWIVGGIVDGDWWFDWGGDEAEMKEGRK
jgi:hypothetical protein